MSDTLRFRLRTRCPVALRRGGGGGAHLILPSGEYARRDDPATHRNVVVAGTYHLVPRARPSGPSRLSCLFRADS